MRALLDTHSFLWFNANDERLSVRVRDLMVNSSNDIIFSAVVAWEIAIKYGRGRLPEIDEDPASYVPSRVAHYRLRTLPIEVGHALRAGALPLLHRDPFDRLLVAQAQLERLPIVTSDPNIARYDVEIIW